MASYGALEGGSLSASDIPASGGTSSTNVTNMSQTISYTSGSTRAGTVTYSKQMRLQFLLLEPQLRQELRLDKLL